MSQQPPFNPQQPPQHWQQGPYPQQGQPFPSGQYPPTQGQSYQQTPQWTSQQFSQEQQSSFMPPQPPAPKKKSRKGLIIGGIIVVVALLICVIASSTHGGSPATATNPPANNTASSTQKQPTQAPTTKPTQAPTWTTVQSFSGNGSKNTPAFQIGDNWKIVWTCNPASFDGGSYNVIITPTGTDGVPTDQGVNTTCKAGNTSGDTTVQAGGTIALDIISEGDWTIKVEQLK